MRSRSSIFAVVAGVIFFGTLVIFSASRPAAFLREGAVRLLAPVSGLASGAGRWLAFGLEGLSPERVRFLREVETRLEAAAAALDDVSEENEALRRALGLKRESGQSIRSARVILYRQELRNEILIIDVGRKDGVHEGDPVIDEERLLIGQISEVSEESSKVAVASNPGAAFSAVLVPLGGKILAKGLGGRAFALELIPMDVPLRSGDFIRWVRDGDHRGQAIFAGSVVGMSPGVSGGFKTGRAVLVSHPELAEQVLVITRE